MDCHYSSDIKSPSMEFTWEGSDEMDPASGSGRIEIIDGKLEGIIYFHLGDESTFTAEKTQ
ncbi:hypothetical protein K8I28_11120 [bacterium]|nr:hypothetical protein [bacterium]